MWGKLTDISYTLNRVPTSVHTLPSHEHLGNHLEDWFPSITSRIVTGMKSYELADIEKMPHEVPRRMSDTHEIWD